ncbi:MAG: HEAT repeat domain-containing protein, partial [Methanobacterium sp.]
MSEGKRIDFLIEELQDKNWTVREDAAELLAEIGDPEAVEPLINTLKD